MKDKNPEEMAAKLVTVLLKRERVEVVHYAGQMTPSPTPKVQGANQGVSRA